MASVSLEVYLFFNGECQEAMNFYKGIFGGELTTQKYGDVPGNTDEAYKDKIIHADLHGGAVQLMAGDDTVERHNTGKIELSLVGDDESKLRGFFNALADGGTVRQPLEKQYWGDVFGSLTDKFGIGWMFNIDSGQPQT